MGGAVLSWPSTVSPCGSCRIGGRSVLFNCNGIQVAADRIPEGSGRASAVRELCASLSCPARHIRVEKDALGAPRLAGAERLPAVSFCSSHGQYWAAVAWAEGLGVDMACPREFERPYPYARVFNDAEVGLAASLGREGPDGYALLWSLKESAAKALGIGFHCVEPGEVVVAGLQMAEQGLEANVLAPSGCFSGLAVPRAGCWLAFAVQKG